MGKSMCRKHQYVFQDHVKYIHSVVMKPLGVGILQYPGHVCDMHDLAKLLYPSSKKGDEYEYEDWTVCNK